MLIQTWKQYFLPFAFHEFTAEQPSLASEIQNTFEMQCSVCCVTRVIHRIFMQTSYIEEFSLIRV